MARPKVPEAPARHPARKILADHTAQEIADALGVKPAAVYAARKDLRLPLADKIVEAFATPVSPPPPKNKRGSNSAFVTGDHPAWEALEKHSAAEIAAKCGESVETIKAIAERGLRPGLAESIAAAFPIKEKDEERMKDALRTAALAGEGDGSIPQLREKKENPEAEPPSAAPVKTWVDPSVKRQPDLLAQLLRLEGAVLIIPVAELAKLRSAS